MKPMDVSLVTTILAFVVVAFSLIFFQLYTNTDKHWTLEPPHVQLVPTKQFSLGFKQDFYSPLHLPTRDREY